MLTTGDIAFSGNAAHHRLRRLVVGCVTWFGGGITTEERIDRQRTAMETETLTPILASDPAFKDVQIQKRSAGGVILFGEVPTAADLARLRALVVQQLGETWLSWRFNVEAADRLKR